MILTRARRSSLLQPLACLGAIAAVAGAANADSLSVDLYDAPDGQRYYAASFAAIDAPARPEAMDLVIVVDTSASQVGPFRTTTLAAVEACLASLHPNDRVELVAADVSARHLTDAPVAPGSSEMAAAMASLQQIAPLGASEFRTTLATAADRLAASSESPRKAILYLGDGLSMGGNELAGAWSGVVERLRDQQIAVSAFALGPQRNPALLAALANQTGGNLYIDAPGLAADDAEAGRRGARVGRILSDWAHAEVAWATSSSMSEAAVSAYPTAMPPLRSDRDTVVIGQLAPGAERLTVDATIDGESLAWSASLDPSHESSAALATLVQQAERDGGLSLTTLGSAGLTETMRVANAETERLTRIAERAVALGDTAGATKISQAVLKRDPGNLRAKTVQRAGEERSVRTAQLEIVEAAPVEDLVAPQAPAAQPSVVFEDQGFMPPSEVVVDGRFMNSVDRNRKVFAQLLEKEVKNAIADARDTMATDPESAIQSLKLMLQNVERAPELSSAIRAGLSDRLQSAVREATRQAVIQDDLDREREEVLAAARERRLLLDRLALKREREKQLVERFNALIDERRFAEATEVSLEVEEIDPDSVIARVTRVWGEQKRYHELNRELRDRRAAMFLETMAQVESSAIPFPDNVPMVYPDAEEWQRITEARRKYKSVDVAGESESERAITDALQKPLPTSGLQFDDAPLEDVVTFLREEYNIEIALDSIALDDLGLGPDEPITVDLRNTSLKSALRRMLEPLELTYVLEDEVLLITTEEEAQTKLKVKVYPVADLVIPIPPPQAAGIGGGGGGLGGGGGGGLGGGGGGGLGGGGGGGLGGGGGAFSVPDEAPVLSLRKDAPQSTPTEPEATPASPSASTEITPEVSAKAPSLRLPAADADDSAWEGLFVEKVDPASVRRATRRLVRTERYGDAVRLINAALRAGQQQSWMYESLGLALQLDGRPLEEIERTVLSSVDFATEADQLVAIADYLVGLGLDRRAVQVYRMALDRAPLLQEILGPALAAAKRSGDADALRWATIAVAERAWPATYAAIEEQSKLISQALVERLESEDTAAAASYRKQLDAASRRDCLVRVTWSGDADLDLAVKEPGGSVCWLGKGRTAGGGVRVEAPVNADDESAIRSEEYICPRGLAGDYEVLVRKIWGEPVADLVTVEVTVAAGDENEEVQSRQVKLDENGETRARFNLPVGRLEQPIDEAVLAQALERQENVARSVVAQQLSSLAEEGTVSLRPGDERRRRQALAGQGAVGFQPVIITLPEGTNLQASAVVSADRRYVRVSPTPIFSVIGDIFTFSFTGGGIDPTTQFVDQSIQSGQVGQAGVGGVLAGGGGQGGGGGGLGGGGGGGGGGGNP